ncbi:hypothetical protein ACWGLE_13730 [Streptomyces sp. NPDC055897]
MIEFGHRVVGIRDGADNPALRRRLLVADLYELTEELFWGELTFKAGDADLSRPGPVLDAAYCFHVLSGELEGRPKRTYSAAGGAGEFSFTRKGDVLRIREERGPVVSVSYQEFRGAAEAFIRVVIADLCRLYPELDGNEEMLNLKRRLKSA